MAKYVNLGLFFISCILILTTSLCYGEANDERQVYIVYMGSLLEGEYSPLSHHLRILQEVCNRSSVRDILIRSYKRSFNGFSAKLNFEEKQRLASMKNVVSVFPSRTLHVQTTRSWDFMGFPENVSRNPSVESDVIVGVIDTGIWPESESFTDKGFGPPPKKWKGACIGGSNFTCNNKIIGARFYSSSGSTDDTARDKEGHGTHTASTAVGNRVTDVSFFGLAQGTARGGVPSARVAVYKVCHPDSGCEEEHILAAFDDAIADGVDIITISLGAHTAVDFKTDSIAIGSFHAMKKGILTLNSAGNDGPQPGTVYSIAPWMLSVAASSTDRRIIDKVVLGNGRTLIGNSVNSFTLNGTKFPLTYREDASIQTQCPESLSRICESVNTTSMAGKIVLCEVSEECFEVSRAGAVGAIWQDDVYHGFSFVVPLPALALNNRDYSEVNSYMNSAKNPEATILKSEAKRDFVAPVVVSFSSRGPNPIVSDILKPDLTAPGVDILAAFSLLASPSDTPIDKRSVKYSILSGTSMSCPHVAGAAAYVKTFHPDWSPSAIKSALMTTARPMNSTKNQDHEFAYGSGHIDPIKAVDPGLVYEAYEEDYIKLLCNIGYNAEAIRQLSGDNITCPQNSTLPKDLNYPTMAAKIPLNTTLNISFHRTLTNVGLPNSTYIAKVASSSKVKIQVEPTVLSFKSLNEKKSFVVSVAGARLPQPMVLSASLVWSDGTRSVRSPIIIFNIPLWGRIP